MPTSALSSRTTPASGDQTPTRRACQRRLARCAGADDRHQHAGRGAERNAFQDRVAAAGRAQHEVLHRHLARRPRQRRARFRRRALFEQFIQPRVGAARRHEAAPGAHGEVHRGQRAAEQDRRRDHAARRQLVVQHQQGAEAEDGRLHGDARKAGQPADPGRAVACLGLQREKPVLPLLPAAAQARQHAHRLDRLGVAQLAGRVVLRRLRDARRLREHGTRWRARSATPARRAATPRRTRRRPATDAATMITRMKIGVHGASKNANSPLPVRNWRMLVRSPSAWPGLPLRVSMCARNEASNTRAPSRRSSAALARIIVLRANQFERGVEHVQADHDQRQHQQRRLVAARQHAVVDLQHVQRGHQHQQVDRAAEAADGEEDAAEGGEGGAQFGAGRAARARGHCARPRSTPGAGRLTLPAATSCCLWA